VAADATSRFNAGETKLKLEKIMRELNLTLILGLTALVLSLSPANLAAQPRPDWANMDPQQMQQMIQQRMLDSVREQLAVTNNDEWTIIQVRLSKVMQGKMESAMSNMGGMRGMMGRNRGNDGSGAPRGFIGFGRSDPDAEALQKALDAKAPTDQIKAALTKLRESRKRKVAALAAAQDELRQVLSFRQ
jgi:hypothetical protein